MKDFADTPHCHACGSSEVTVKYHDPVKLTLTITLGSYLKVTCKRCSYNYEMRPKNAEPEEVKREPQD